MPNNEIAGTIRRAYFPYVKGFLYEPERARLKVQIEDDGSCYATLRLAPDDFEMFDDDVHLRAHHRRAYNALAWWQDEDLAPHIDFLSLDE